jgi:DNA (cytosine-5)-methyltransferase 1
VPEAAVDEHGYVRAAKEDVRPAPQAWFDEGVDAVAQASPVESATDGKLRFGVARPVAEHHCPGSRVRRRWRRERIGVARRLGNVRHECEDTIRAVPALTAVDLFSGAGGTTQGLRDAGYEVLVAVESDPAAAQTYRANHADTVLLDRKIQHVQAPALARRLAREDVRLDLLTACPPCQPFSTLGTGKVDDERNALVSSIARFVTHLRPRAVMLENVPGLRRERRFERLVDWLRAGYEVEEYVVQAADFGVPQSRRRVIVLAVEKDSGTTPPEDLLSVLPEDFDCRRRTAGEALAAARRLRPEDDAVHRARTPKPKTLERIRAVRQGGGRLQLPEHLQLKCHASLKRRDATSIYGRIDPSDIAPTMTTRCTTPSCGRFVHPDEDRGLTLREAALIQTFPLDYRFRGNYGEIEVQIGNAVPPRLAQALGLVVAGLLVPAPFAEAA